MRGLLKFTLSQRWAPLYLAPSSVSLTVTLCRSAHRDTHTSHSLCSERTLQQVSFSNSRLFLFWFSLYCFTADKPCVQESVSYNPWEIPGTEVVTENKEWKSWVLYVTAALHSEWCSYKMVLGCGLFFFFFLGLLNITEALIIWTCAVH